MVETVSMPGLSNPFLFGVRGNGRDTLGRPLCMNDGS
jgi:hypothetical protein